MKERLRPGLNNRQKEALRQRNILSMLGHGRNDDYVSSSTYEKIFDQLGSLEGARIIDVGAGLATISDKEGTFLTPILEDKGVTLIPVDVSHRHSKTWNLHRDLTDSLNVAPVTADSFKLPFKDESIDGCVSVNLINFPWSHEPGMQTNCHVMAYSLLLEMKRVIKKGGFVILSSFGYNKWFLKDGSFRYNDDITEDQMIGSSEIRQLASQVGFTDISEIPLDETLMRESTQKFERNQPDAVRMEIIDPFAFLIKKPK